jgi:holo-[acyl-carrier protein] synthase
MIIGLGSDIIEISRVRRALYRFGDRFLKRIFSDHEQMRAMGLRNPVASLAKRFVAKEACSKALGTGMSQGLSWQDMEVKNLSQGQPTLRLSSVANDLLIRLVPKEYVSRIHLSLSDSVYYAQAVVIIEALKE